MARLPHDLVIYWIYTEKINSILWSDLIVLRTKKYINFFSKFLDKETLFSVL